MLFKVQNLLINGSLCPVCPVTQSIDQLSDHRNWIQGPSLRTYNHTSYAMKYLLDGQLLSTNPLVDESSFIANHLYAGHNYHYLCIQ